MMAQKIFCKECQFWKRVTEAPAKGECHRKAPGPVIREKPEKQMPLLLVWPITVSEDFCGDGILAIESRIAKGPHGIPG